jgi:hypothetical protein
MILDKLTDIKDTLEEVFLKEDIYTNIGKTERILSIAGGAYICFKGVRNLFSSPLIASGELVVGYKLLQRGVSGYSEVTEKMEREVEGPEPILIIK